MKVMDIVNHMLDPEESVAVYDTTESDYLRILCKGYAGSIDLNTEQRGFVGDEEMISLIAMDNTLYLGIGNPLV